MAVVVRCPGCRGMSQVGPEAVGLLVVCPRCHDPFLAVTEAPPPAPPPRPEPPPVPPPRPTRTWAEPVAPPSDAPRRRRPDRGRRARPGERAAPVDPHDHSPLPAGGLPVSVMIGLALLPLTIPLLWLIAPLVVGRPPVLTIATPVSLAVAASVLCLAVVYTIDWTPATRIKGVLMLVGLAYFAGGSLYFLKRGMVDQVRQLFGPTWTEFHPPDWSYEVSLPGRPPVNPAPDPPLIGLKCYKASLREPGEPEAVYLVGSGDDQNVRLPEKAWFDDVGAKVLRAAQGGQQINDRALPPVDQHPGREWTIRLPQPGTVRIVRVYRAPARVYYLSAEGPNLTADSEHAQKFFDSFQVLERKK